MHSGAGVGHACRALALPGPQPSHRAYQDVALSRLPDESWGRGAGLGSPAVLRKLFRGDVLRGTLTAMLRLTISA